MRDLLAPLSSLTDAEIRVAEIAAAAGAAGALLGRGSILKGALIAAGVGYAGLRLFGPRAASPGAVGAGPWLNSPGAPTITSGFYADLTRNLGIGPVETVRATQQILNLLAGRHFLVVDGILGPRTAEALRQFQQHQGIFPSGALDDETAHALSYLGAAVSQNPQVHEAAVALPSDMPVTYTPTPVTYTPVPSALPGPSGAPGYYQSFAHVGGPGAPEHEGARAARDVALAILRGHPRIRSKLRGVGITLMDGMSAVLVNVRSPGDIVAARALVGDELSGVPVVYDVVGDIIPQASDMGGPIE